MFCIVYFARRKGQARSDEEVRASPVYGELALCLRSRYGATLINPDSGRNILPALDQVTIEVRRAGLLLIGQEAVPRRPNASSSWDYYPQKWWCLPAPRPEPRQAPASTKDIDKMARSLHTRR